MNSVEIGNEVLLDAIATVKIFAFINEVSSAGTRSVATQNDKNVNRRMNKLFFNNSYDPYAFNKAIKLFKKGKSSGGIYNNFSKIKGKISLIRNFYPLIRN